MRVILTSIGNAGDVFPLIAVGRALHRRGHDVLMLLNPLYRRRVETLDMQFRPLGSAAETRRLMKAPFMRRPQSGLRHIWRQVVLPNTPRLIEALDEECRTRRPDWIVHSPASIAASWICRRYDVRRAVTTFSPKIWLEYNTGDVHGVASPYETRPERIKRRALHATRRIARRFTDRDLNRFRTQFGYPPQRDVFARQFLDSDLNLGLWSPVLRGKLDSDPLNGHICGFTWYDDADDGAPAIDELRDFFDAGDPPIVFTMGTTIVTAAGNFYDIAADACKLLGRRGVLLTGSAANRPRHAAPDVLACDFAPFSEAFPRACATVHHGGAGTLGQALRAGKPSVIIPVAWDQFDNAAWAARLKTSVTLARASVTPRTLAAALKRVLESEAARRRALRVAERMRAEDGAATAATALEKHASSVLPQK